MRILDLGEGRKQETKKKFQRKDWNQQETYLTNDVSLETNQEHHGEGQVRGWEGRGGGRQVFPQVSIIAPPLHQIQKTTVKKEKNTVALK